MRSASEGGVPRGGEPPGLVGPDEPGDRREGRQVQRPREEGFPVGGGLTEQRFDPTPEPQYAAMTSMPPPPFGFGGGLWQGRTGYETAAAAGTPGPAAAGSPGATWFPGAAPQPSQAQPLMSPFGAFSGYRSEMPPPRAMAGPPPPVPPQMPMAGPPPLVPPQMPMTVPAPAPFDTAGSAAPPSGPPVFAMTPEAARPDRASPGSRQSRTSAPESERSAPGTTSF